MTKNDQGRNMLASSDDYCVLYSGTRNATGDRLTIRGRDSRRLGHQERGTPSLGSSFAISPLL